MNKELEEILNPYSFEYYGDMGFGVFKGYEVNVYLNRRNMEIVCQFSTYLSNEKKAEIVNTLNERFSKKVKCEENLYGIIIRILSIGFATSKKQSETLKEVMDAAYDEILNNEGSNKQYCPICGLEMNDANSKYIQNPYNSFRTRICLNDVEKINMAINKANQDFKNSKNNYLLGTCGLLLGSLAGVVVMFLLAQINIISSFSPIVSIILGTYLYKKFGGKANAMMIILSFIITFIVMGLGVVLLYSVSAASTLAESYPNISLVEAFKIAMEYDEIKTALIKDVVIMSIFTLVAEGYSAYSLAQSIKRPREIK